jgi:hypothetical protein
MKILSYVWLAVLMGASSACQKRTHKGSVALINELGIAYKSHLTQVGPVVGADRLQEVIWPALLSKENALQMQFAELHEDEVNSSGLPVDQWGQPLMVQFTGNTKTEIEIRSSGIDQTFGTRDDIARTFDIGQ